VPAWLPGPEAAEHTCQSIRYAPSAIRLENSLSDGRLQVFPAGSFNDELRGMDKKLGDYVIVHELLHFSVPNNGKLLKVLMRVPLENWEQSDARLEGPRSRTPARAGEGENSFKVRFQVPSPAQIADRAANRRALR